MFIAPTLTASRHLELQTKMLVPNNPAFIAIEPYFKTSEKLISVISPPFPIRNASKPADCFHSVILPFSNFILPLELIIWHKHYLIVLAQGHFQRNFPTPSHFQEQAFSNRIMNASRKQKMQTSMSWYLFQILSQLLGISALAAALSLLVRGTASTALQLTQPLERCCFQGLFSNI